MSHVPVSYLDQLKRLGWRLRLLRINIQEHDAEVGRRLERIEAKLRDVTMAMNHTGAEREEYLRDTS